MNIAEAMIHGKPVISHYSSVDNAQAELLEDGPFGPAGLVVAEDDRVAYVEAVQTLLADKGLRLALGQNGKRKAETLFAEDVWALKVEGYYLEMVSA
jgi:glycosyltransferase involved in cell wall biosynthesis